MPSRVGKSSITLDVLYNNHVKEQFNKNRFFIRCDRLLLREPNSSVESPRSLAWASEIPRILLSPVSREMLFIFDNAEQTSDPQEMINERSRGIRHGGRSIQETCLRSYTSRVKGEEVSTDIP